MSFKALTQVERIAMLEIKVDSLAASVTSMEGKIDELLALRNKGAGAFGLASLLFGTSLVGLVSYVLGWIKP